MHALSRGGDPKSAQEPLGGRGLKDGAEVGFLTGNRIEATVSARSQFLGKHKRHSEWVAVDPVTIIFLLACCGRIRTSSGTQARRQGRRAGLQSGGRAHVCR